jgi:hypothetical protein
MGYATHLFRRCNGIYYFRTRIPSDLQPHFARSEISRSLNTQAPSAAIRLARMYIVQLQTAFDSIRDIHMRQRTELTELITISRTVQNGDKTDYRRFYNRGQNSSTLPPNLKDSTISGSSP